MNPPELALDYIDPALQDGGFRSRVRYLVVEIGTPPSTHTKFIYRKSNTPSPHHPTTLAPMLFDYNGHALQNGVFRSLVRFLVVEI